MGGWWAVCTNSVNMVLLCFYIKDRVYARDTEQVTKTQAGTFYKGDEQSDWEW